MAELVVATFNTHAGVDGWGRRYDLVAACAEIDADVLVLQEVWTPSGGPSMASVVADRLGYEAFEVPLADAVRLGPVEHPGGGWGPRPRDPHLPRRLWVGGDEQVRERRLRGRSDGAAPGKWGIAVLSRRPTVSSEVIELGKLRRDYTRRAAVRVDVATDGGIVPVVGTHLAHFSHGSAFQLAELRRRLPPASGPAVLAGDMNLWGPPVSSLLPGWRRAVRGPTWPSGRPHSQIDHILVSRPVRVLGGGPLVAGASDHRPLRAGLAWG